MVVVLVGWAGYLRRGLGVVSEQGEEGVMALECRVARMLWTLLSGAMVPWFSFTHDRFVLIER